MKSRAFRINLYLIIVFLVILSANLFAIFCPECGHENTDNAKFCVKCGEKLPTLLDEETVEDTLQKQIQEMRDEGISEETINLFIESQKNNNIQEKKIKDVRINVIFINKIKSLQISEKGGKGINVNCKLDNKTIFNEILKYKQDKELKVKNIASDNYICLDVRFNALTEYYPSRTRKVKYSRESSRNKLKFKIDNETATVKVTFFDDGTLLALLPEPEPYRIKFETEGCDTGQKYDIERFNELSNNIKFTKILETNNNKTKAFHKPRLFLNDDKLEILFSNPYNKDIIIKLDQIADIKTKACFLNGHYIILETKKGNIYWFDFFPKKIAKEMAQIIKDKL